MKTILTLFPSARTCSWLPSSGLALSMGLWMVGSCCSSLRAQSVVSGQVTLSSTLAVVAGTGSTVPSGTAVAATAAKLSSPSSVAIDASGNLYLADAANNLVEQVNPAGQLVVIAGGGGTVPSATLEAAANAQLNNPVGVAVDTAGNIYVADATNNLVEQVSPAGQIVVIAGGGGTVPSFTSEAAASAKLSNPTGVAVDSAGNIYIADQGNNLVEEVTAGQIVVIIGGGIKNPSSAFSRGAATVKLINPSSIAVDGAQNVYIVDQGRSKIEELTAGQVTVVIGGGSTVPSLTAEAGTSAQLSSPSGITIDRNGNFYIADQGNNLIEKVSAGQVIVALAGGGATLPTTAAGIPGSAQLNGPTGAAGDAAGNVYIADRGNNLVEKVEQPQTILPVTAVGSTSPSQTVQVTLQSANVVSSITVPKASNGAQEFTVGPVTGCTVGGVSNPAGTVCLISVTFSPAYPGVRTGALTLTSGATVLGTAGLYGTGEGPEMVQLPGTLSVIAGGGSAAPGTTPAAPLTIVLKNPTGVAVDGAGNIYVVAGTAGSATVNEISAATGQIRVVAGGGGTVPGAVPSPATGASIIPFGITVDGAGNLYIADYSNALVEKVDASTGQIVAIAGGGSNGPGTTPEAALTAAIYPFGVAIDKTGNLYIADKQTQYSGGQIEEIPAGTGQIVLVAGGGYSTPNSTPQPAIGSGFYQLTNVAVDGVGNYYVADAGDDRVEKVTASTGQIIAIAGFGPNVPGAILTPATDASLNNPYSVAVDAAGDVYIVDSSNGLIEQVNPAGQIVAIAGGGRAAASMGSAAGTQVALSNPTGIAIDGAGNLIITDSGNNLVEKLAATASPLAFSDTYVATLNSSQQMVTLDNIGNQTLNIANVSTVGEFPAVPTGACMATAQALLPGTSCALIYSFLPTTVGTLNEVATLTDNNLNATNATQTVSLSGTGVAPIVAVNPASYTLTVNPSSLTIKAGQTGTATLTLNPTGGYAGLVTLSCANLPANTLCAFSQTTGVANSVTLDGSNHAAPVTLTIQTNVQQTVASATRHRLFTSMAPALAICFPGSLVWLAAFGRRKKQGDIRVRQRLLWMGLLIFMTAAIAGDLAGCGGGSNSSLTTPASTSTVTVTSSAAPGSSGLSQSVSFTLTITR